MRKVTKVTDKTKFTILVDLCESKGIWVCPTYKASFYQVHAPGDIRWWTFQLNKGEYIGDYKVIGTNMYEDELISYEDMIDIILGINKTITLSLSNLLTANYTQGDSCIKMGNDDVDIVKLEELLTKVNQLNA
jgi:hypothetical protein